MGCPIVSMPRVRHRCCRLTVTGALAMIPGSTLSLVVSVASCNCSARPSCRRRCRPRMSTARRPICWVRCVMVASSFAVLDRLRGRRCRRRSRPPRSCCAEVGDLDRLGGAQGDARRPGRKKTSMSGWPGACPGRSAKPSSCIHILAGLLGDDLDAGAACQRLLEALVAVHLRRRADLALDDADLALAAGLLDDLLAERAWPRPRCRSR